MTYRMRRLRRQSLLALSGLALGLFVLLPAPKAQDAFAGANTGTLWLEIELSGSGRTDLPNGVEWAALDATRSIALQLRMVDVGNGGVPIVPVAGVGGARGANPLIPAGLEEMEAAMAACHGDQACQMLTSMRFSQEMMVMGQAFADTLESKRFGNWSAARTGDCAAGTMSVRDVGQGVVISPPSPAAPYRFERAGSIDLPGGLEAIRESVCSAELTHDTESGLVSLRLPTGGLMVPVALSGHAFTDETAVPLIEGQHLVELLDQPSTGQDLGGQVTLDRLGSASHNSGQVVAPLRATITWWFQSGGGND